MTIHALFPTLLLEEDDAEYGFVKDVYMKAVMRHLTPDGYSNERTGHVTLHHDQIFEPICVMATKMARQYCEVNQIDPALFDFNIVKTWLNILDKEVTPFHSHDDAHLSFCYYINTPEDSKQKLRFYAHPLKYEAFPGFVKFNDPAEWNIFNSQAWSFDAVEGKMFFWPSGMCHDTWGTTPEKRDEGVTCLDDLRNRRVTFAGDIVLTYKEKAAKPMGLQPRRNWRTFSTGEGEDV